jgi:hypothetical protein
MVMAAVMVMDIILIITMAVVVIAAAIIMGIVHIIHILQQYIHIVLVVIAAAVMVMGIILIITMAVVAVADVTGIMEDIITAIIIIIIHTIKNCSVVKNIRFSNSRGRIFF